MSHAWPLISEVSPRALAIDPSINTFMNAPDAPAQLQAHSLSPASLRFIVILREPLARAQSSARMMREWKWDRAGNTSTSLLGDLAQLRRCCESLAPEPRTSGPALDGASGLEVPESPWERAAGALARASDAPLRRFRRCLARSAPLNHVRASVYAAGVLGWLSAGFAPSSFLWLETEAMRAMRSDELLRTIAGFARLPIQHLPRLPPDVRAACDGRAVADAAVTAAAQSAAAVGRRGRLTAAPFDGRMKSHVHRALPVAVARPLHDAFLPFNGLLRTLLADVAPTLRGVKWLA